MKMIPTANKMINCEQWESLQSSAVEANPGQGWVWHFLWRDHQKQSVPLLHCNLHSSTALHITTHKQSCEEQAVLSAAAAQQGNTGKGWLKVFQGGGLSQDCSGLSAKMKGGWCCEISPCLVYAQPYHIILWASIASSVFFFVDSHSKTNIKSLLDVFQSLRLSLFWVLKENPRGHFDNNNTHSPNETLWFSCAPGSGSLSFGNERHLSPIHQKIEKSFQLIFFYFRTYSYYCFCKRIPIAFKYGAFNFMSLNFRRMCDSELARGCMMLAVTCS